MAQVTEQIATQIDNLRQWRDVLRDTLVSFGVANSEDTLGALVEIVAAMRNNGAVNIAVKEGDSYTIPAGYHDGTGVVIAQTDPEGDYERYQLQSKSVTPTKSAQSVAPDDGFYGLSGVTVQKIPDAYQDVSKVTATAPDVLAGKIVVTAGGAVITGSMKNHQGMNRILTNNEKSFTSPEGYHTGTGEVKIMTEERDVIPTESVQEILPDAIHVLSKVTVEAIPATYANTSAATLSTEDLLSGKVAFGTQSDAESGEQVAVKLIGTMVNRGAYLGEMDGISEDSYTIPKGYHDGNGRIKLTSAIADALAEIVGAAPTVESGECYVLFKQGWTNTDKLDVYVDDQFIGTSDMVSGIYYGKHVRISGNVPYGKVNMVSNADFTVSSTTRDDYVSYDIVVEADLVKNTLVEYLRLEA